jgi:hypothetical protein
MERVAALGRLAGRADVEPVRDPDVHVLVGGLGHAAAYDREILLLVRARRMGVDEGRAAGFEIAVPDDTAFHVLRCHGASLGVL